MEKRGIIVIVIALAIIAIFLIFWTYEKNCYTDECFDNAARKCNKAEYVKIDNGNTFKYDIERSYGDSCRLNIKIEEIDDAHGQELKNLFQGKSMTCDIPKDKFNVEFLKLENSIDYCHGILKEAMYELILQRIYDLAVKQIGDVVFEIEDVLEKVKSA